MEAGTLRGATTPRPRTSGVRRLATETKAGFRTSEFMMVVGTILAILIAAAAVKGGDTGGTDEFIARQAWLYVTILVAAYAIGRGLAKSGSNEPYFAERDGDDLGNAGGRSDR